MVRKSFRYSEDGDPPPPTPPRQMPPGLVKLPPGYYVTSNPPYKTWTAPPTPPPPSRNSKPSSSPPPPKIRSSSPPPPSDSGSASPESSNQEAPGPESSSGDTSPSPAPDSGGNSNKNSNSNSNSNSKSMVIGAAVGGSLLLIFMAVLVVCIRKRKRASQLENSKDNPGGNKGDYYDNEKHTNWYGKPSPPEHILKIPPSAGGVRWAVMSPLPPMRQTNDVSTDFSGPYHPPMPPPHPGISIGYNNSSFSYEDLAAATGGFDNANLLGQGGFGYVYKGVLPNGKEVAVKSLKSGSGQGEREFQAEVDIISRVHHRHLVSLVGYCIAGSQRMLVYEFVPNNTLEYHLHGEDCPTMEWPIRLKIALGSAKGFAYLHEDCHPRIIHRDIKAANILLDFNFEAKVADFGLAKLNSDTHTHVSTRIMGTFGYLAPEYASSGKLTEKSDVYSYGVVLLELISGRRPVDINVDDDDNLVDWARPILMRSTEGGGYEEMIDPKLQDNYKPQEMLRMVACAAACIRHSAKRRPKMSQVVRALEGDVSLDDLNSGAKPGHSTVFGSFSSSDQYDDNSSYGTEMKKFRKVVALSQEFSSGEHRPAGELARQASSADGTPDMRPAGELAHQASSANETPDMHPSRTQTPDP